MFNIENLAKLGLQGWPLVAAIGLVVGGVVSFWQGWPWEGIIVINQNCKCKKDDSDE